MCFRPAMASADIKCPRCGHPITEQDGDVCPKCGLSKADVEGGSLIPKPSFVPPAPNAPKPPATPKAPSSGN